MLAFAGCPLRFVRVAFTARQRVLIAALVGALLAGCRGESNPTSPESTSPDKPGTPAVQEANIEASPTIAVVDSFITLNPCELLTPAELETFFGEPAEAGAAPETIGPYRSCMFTNQSGGKMIILQVTHQTPAQFKIDNESSAAMIEMVPTPVAGLGDESVFFSGLLRVRTGDVVTQVATWHPEAEQAEAFAMTQEIARIAIGRLP